MTVENNETEQPTTEATETPDTQDEQKPGPKPFDEDYVRRLREENKQRRLETKQLQEQLNNLQGGLKQALGLQDDTDPAERVQQLTTERDQLATERLDLQREHAALRAAITMNLDADRLLDSRRFTNRLNQLDPTAEDFDKDLSALLTDAANADATLTITNTPPASGTPEHTGAANSSDYSVNAIRRRINRKDN